MKYFLLGASTIFSFIISFMLSDMDPNLSREESLINKISSSSAEAIKKKYKLYPSGLGISMPGGDIKEVSLIFTSYHCLSKESLRKILMESADLLLDRINSNIDIRPYLNVFPFTEKNIEIVIFNSDQTGYGLVDPKISVSEISRGNFIFRTMDPLNADKYKNTYRETYEEALEALQKETQIRKDL